MVRFGPIEKLGTIWWFEFFDLSELKKQQVEIQIQKIMNEFQDNYSRFKSDSILSKLNKNRIVNNPSKEFVEMLLLAQDAFIQTKGVFNIAVAKQLMQSGYDSSYSFHSQELDKVDSLNEVVTISDTQIELSGNSELDFGGFGKGYLIDKLAVMFEQEMGLKYFLINGGGDIFVTSNYRKPIEIAIQNPETKENTGLLNLQNQGFACSSPVLRQWQDQNGVTYDHLVGDTQKQTVYVTAPCAVIADIWATTLAINGDTLLPSNVAVHGAY